jgi:DedD protein
MPLPSIHRRKKPPAAPRPETPVAGAPAVVEQARTRARRRLIGAVVLLGIGVIAFPLLFETEPRPIPVDLPIEIPKRDAVPPLAMPSAAARSEAATASAAETRVELSPSALPALPALSAPAPVPPPAVETRPAEKPADPPAEKPATAAVKPDDGARAKALLEGKPPAAAAEARYVVQIGAFAEDRTVREVRAKAQKAGQATHTQQVTVSSGSVTRVRVGPFPTRKEADAAAAALRKADLPATVLKL